MNRIIAAVAVLGLVSLAQAKSIVLGSDSIAWRESSLPGYTLVSQKCAICHSAHYAEYQPPNTKAGYWKAQVLRMKNVFNAPIDDDEISAIVEYLDQTYGAHRK
jgi:sulfite dehydrogenase (cytochrome) subunit B